MQVTQSSNDMFAVNERLTVHLLLMPNVHLLDLAGPAQVFASERLDCELSFVSAQPSVRSTQGVTLNELEALPEAPPDNSCLIVIGCGLMAEQLHTGTLDTTINWLQKTHAGYRQLAAVCSGSLLLGKAGLLDHIHCTTHHDLTEQLRLLAPIALVEENTLLVEDGRCVTSAGISTGIDLSLHLVSKYWGARLSQQIARDMVVYQRRHGDEQTLSFWLQHRNHVERTIHDIQDKLMAAPGRDWRIAELAEDACISERQFRRRFERATGVKVQQYIRLARLELSRQLLAQTDLGLEGIAERCGFSDERSLRRLWQQLKGVSPGEYRRLQIGL